MVRVLVLTLLLFLGVFHLIHAVPYDKKNKKEMKPITIHSIQVHVSEAYDPYRDPAWDPNELTMNRLKLPDPYVIVKYRPFLEDGTLSSSQIFLGKTRVHQKQDHVKFDETIAYYGQDSRRPTTNGVVDLEVWDRDGLGFRDDFIGYARVDLRDPSLLDNGNIGKYRTPLIGGGYDTKQYGIGYISFDLHAKLANPNTA
jgi:hypothetical protein